MTISETGYGSHVEYVYYPTHRHYRGNFVWMAHLEGRLHHGTKKEPELVVIPVSPGTEARLTAIAGWLEEMLGFKPTVEQVIDFCLHNTNLEGARVYFPSKINFSVTASLAVTSRQFKAIKKLRSAYKLRGPLGFWAIVLQAYHVLRASRAKHLITQSTELPDA